MAVTTIFARADDMVPERSTVAYQARLTDQADIALTAAALNSLTLTLYDVQAETQAIVNGVNRLNILNTGRGSLAADGTLTITLEPADTVILDETHAFERRRMLIEWTWQAGTRAGRHEVDFFVKNLHYVP